MSCGDEWVTWHPASVSRGLVERMRGQRWVVEGTGLTVGGVFAAPVPTAWADGGAVWFVCVGDAVVEFGIIDARIVSGDGLVLGRDVVALLEEDALVHDH